MSNEPYKAWLASMPIDDVRRKIERLEQKIADARVLERLYSEHRAEGAHEHAEPAPAEEPPSPTSTESEPVAPATGGAEPGEWGAAEGT